MQNERRKMAGCLTLLQREDSAAFLWGGMRLFCTEKCVAIEAEARGDMCISPPIRFTSSLPTPSRTGSMGKMGEGCADEGESE